VTEIFNHPKYGSSGNDWDVSVIKVETPFEWSLTIGMVKLANKEYNVPDGDMLYVSGWGAIKSGGSSPKKLNAVYVPAVNHKVCVNAYGKSVTENMLCAGIGGKDSCQGDSGGPLTHGDYLAGIVSWGRGCALAGYPGVYARVSNMIDFIKKHAK